MKASIAALLALSGLACTDTATAAVRCGPDTISSGSFESAAGARLAGMFGGLDAANVEVRGGGQVVASTVVEAGFFSFDLPPLAPELMLELRVRGLAENGQDFIELASHVGTVQQLIDQADPDGTTRIAGLSGLKVSPESTARYALVSRAGGESAVVAHECQLAVVEAALDPEDVLQRAAVIKILIEDANALAAAAKGTSTTTTLSTVQDDTELAAAINSIETASPGRIADMVVLLQESFCSYFDPEGILLFAPRAYGLGMNAFSGELYSRVDATTGIHINQAGPEGYAWTCNGEQFALEFDGTRVADNFPFRDINGVPTQVYAQLRSLTQAITLVDTNPDFVTVAVHEAWTQTFPLNPELADEGGSGEGRMVVLRQAPGTPFDADAIPGEYLMPTTGTIGDTVADRVRLDPGGTGEQLDVTGESAVTWEVVDGDLLVDFHDRSARLLNIRDEAPTVTDVLGIVEFDDGRRAIGQRLMLRRTYPTLWPDEASVAGNYVQHARRVDEPYYRVELLAGNAGPSWSDYDSVPVSYGSTHFWWSLVGPDQLVLRTCEHHDGTNYVQTPLVDRDPEPGECTTWHRRRDWTVYTTHGDSVYVHERNQDWYSDPTDGQPPDFSFSRAMHYRREPLVAAKTAVDAHTASGSRGGDVRSMQQR